MTQPTTKQPRALTLGQLVATAGVVAFMDESLAHRQGVAQAIQRHTYCDWGDVCEEDKAMNNFALDNGERILSSYTVDGEQIWIITEADRSATTVLFPSDY